MANLARVDERGQGVKNGTLATLESVAPDRFVARLGDGRRVAFSPAEYDHIAHGYAVTIHKEAGPRLHNQLGQVNRGLRRLEQAIAGPEKAIEAIVREIGARILVRFFGRWRC